MIYYIYTDERWEINEEDFYTVEANSPQEALDLFNNGEWLDHDCIGYDYGERLSQKFHRIETDKGEDVTNKLS